MTTGSAGPTRSTTSVQARRLARWRLRSQRLSGAGWSTPADVVAGLLAVQAETPAQAGWALATRCGGPGSFADAAAVAEAQADGRILRTHVLRPTWHFVTPDDLGWLVETTRPGAVRPVRQQLERAGLADRYAALADAVCEAVAAAPLTRSEVHDRLAAAGHDLTRPDLMHLMGHAELDLLVCSGPPRDGEHTYALVDQRAPQRRRLDREEALGELALRYFTGHGPATERDLAYWATLGLRDVRAGIAAAGDRVRRFEHDGSTYFHVGEPPADADLDETAEPAGHLLQIFDEIYRGYQHSRGLLDLAGLVAPGRETSTGLAVVDAQQVGHVKRTLSADTVTFDVRPLRALSRTQQVALERAATRYAEHLALAPRLLIDGAAEGV